MVGLASKWVRLAPNGTNPGLFQIRFQCIWRGTLNALNLIWKAPDLSHFRPIWPTLGPNLTSVFTTLGWRHPTHRVRVLNQGCQSSYKSVILTPNRTNLGVLRSLLMHFGLTSQNALKVLLKSPHNCTIWGQSEAILENSYNIPTSDSSSKADADDVFKLVLLHQYD